MATYPARWPDKPRKLSASRTLSIDPARDRATERVHIARMLAIFGRKPR